MGLARGEGKARKTRGGRMSNVWRGKRIAKSENGWCEVKGKHPRYADGGRRMWGGERIAECTIILGITTRREGVLRCES